MPNSILSGSNPVVNVNVRTLTTSNVAPFKYKTKILRPNSLNGDNIITQQMINEPNTKYVIKFDYTLGDVVKTNLVITSVNYVTINDIKYYYTEIIIDKGKSIKLNNTDDIVIINSNTKEIINETIITAVFTDVTVWLGAKNFDTYKEAYISQNVLEFPVDSIIEFDGGSLNNGCISLENNSKIYPMFNELINGENLTIIGKPGSGTMYFTDKPYWSNGSNWINALGEVNNSI